MAEASLLILHEQQRVTVSRVFECVLYSNQHEHRYAVFPCEVVGSIILHKQ